MILPIHIVAGGLAIILGAVALLVRKGGTIHRRSGLLFVYAMAAMGLSASILALQKSSAVTNLPIGLMAVYLVTTALTAVRPPSTWTRRIDLAAFVIVIAVILVDIGFAVKALNTPRRSLAGVPFPMYFFLASVMTLAAAGDLRVMRFGLRRGGARLARHLWRMCFALFVAAGSFFSIRARVARVLPEPFTSGPMRALPVLLVLVAMFYWLWKVRDRRTRPTLPEAIP